jgi:hypothetical protein
MAKPQTKPLPQPLTLKTPLAHPVAQWLVVGGLVLSLFVAWTALRRPIRPWVGPSTGVGAPEPRKTQERKAPRHAPVHTLEAP